jgi:hypothetical protein
MSFPVYQCEEWQCRYVFPDSRCCGLSKDHDGDHAPVNSLAVRLRHRARFLREALPHAMDFGDDRIINASSVTAIAALLDEAAATLESATSDPARLTPSDEGKADGSATQSPVSQAQSVKAYDL